jgi:hypothetical protein
MNMIYKRGEVFWIKYYFRILERDGVKTLGFETSGKPG